MEFLDLPDEIICYIFQYLDIDTALKTGLVSKEIRRLIYSTNLLTNKIFDINDSNYESVLRCKRYRIRGKKFNNRDILKNRSVICTTFNDKNINLYKNVKSLVIDYYYYKSNIIPHYMGNIPILHLVRSNFEQSNYKCLGQNKQIDVTLIKSNIEDVSNLGNIRKLNLSNCINIKNFNKLGGPNQEELILKYTNITILHFALGNIQILDLTGCKQISDFNVLGGPNQKELILESTNLNKIPEHFGNIPKLNLRRCRFAHNFNVLGGPNQKELILDYTPIIDIPEHFGNIPKLSLANCYNVNNISNLGGPDQKEIIIDSYFKFCYAKFENIKKENLKVIYRRETIIKTIEFLDI